MYPKMLFSLLKIIGYKVSVISLLTVKSNINEFNIKYENAEKLAKEIEIQKDNRFFVIISSNFIFGDFIRQYLCLDH